MCMRFSPPPPPLWPRRGGGGNSKPGSRRGGKKPSPFNKLVAMLADINFSLFQSFGETQPPLAQDGSSPAARVAPLDHRCEHDQLVSDNPACQKSANEIENCSSGLDILVATCKSNSDFDFKEAESNCVRKPVSDIIRQNSLAAV